MKKIIAFLLLTLTLFALEWQSDFKKGYELAKKSDKLLFLFIERLNPPCHWCQKMKKRTLANPQIAQFLQKNFVLVKVDKYSTNYPRELYPKYVPTIYIIDPKREKVIKTIIGFWSPQDFQSDLDDVKRLLK